MSSTPYVEDEQTKGITDFTVSALPAEGSRFVKPKRIHYKERGVSRIWDATESFESVVVLLYHVEKKAFILVRQFRPPVLMALRMTQPSTAPAAAFTYECCAGLVDKPISLDHIVREEILEECGYDVSVDAISKIATYHTSVGTSGAPQHIYYAEVCRTVPLFFFVFVRPFFYFFLMIVEA